MVLNAGSLNRRIQIRRFNRTGTNGFGENVGSFEDHGVPIFANRRDVSDGERLRAEVWTNKLVSRFVVRANAFSCSIRRSDRLIHEGTTWEIDGIKEDPDSRGFIEITATTEETP